MRSEFCILNSSLANLSKEQPLKELVRLSVKRPTHKTLNTLVVFLQHELEFALPKKIVQMQDSFYCLTVVNYGQDGYFVLLHNA